MTCGLQVVGCWGLLLLRGLLSMGHLVLVPFHIANRWMRCLGLLLLYVCSCLCSVGVVVWVVVDVDCSIVFGMVRSVIVVVLMHRSSDRVFVSPLCQWCFVYPPCELSEAEEGLECVW